MKSTFAALCASALALGAIAAEGPAKADPGVTADRIVFGQAAPFEGPASGLGLAMRLGIRAELDRKSCV